MTTAPLGGARAEVPGDPRKDEAGARLRTGALVEREGHVVPAGWPRDEMTCGVCAQRHPRDLCCQSEASTRGERHCGELELITWSMAADAYRADLDVRNAASAVARALERCGRDHGRLFASHARAFRWTCCGAAGDDTAYGCFHHHHVYFRREGSSCACEGCRKSRFENMYNAAAFRFAAPAPETRLLTGVGYFSKNIWNSVAGMRWTRESHALFPRAFRDAVRTLLLVGAAAGGPVGAVLASRDLQGVLVPALLRAFIETYRSRVPMDDLLEFCALPPHMLTF